MIFVFGTGNSSTSVSDVFLQQKSPVEHLIYLHKIGLHARFKVEVFGFFNIDFKKI